MQKNITRQIVGTALFAALSFAVSLLEFPIFPAASFLKLDFSAVFVLLGGFMYGPIAGIIVCAVKELIRFARYADGNDDVSKTKQEYVRNLLIENQIEY